MDVRADPDILFLIPFCSLLFCHSGEKKQMADIVLCLLIDVSSLRNLDSHRWAPQMPLETYRSTTASTEIFEMLKTISLRAHVDPRVGHTMDILSQLISLLCHSDWLFHPGRAWLSLPACTWHCSLHYLFLQATLLFLVFDGSLYRQLYADWYTDLLICWTNRLDNCLCTVCCFCCTACIVILCFVWLALSVREGSFQPHTESIPLTDHQKIWYTWLRRRPSWPCQIGC